MKAAWAMSAVVFGEYGGGVLIRSHFPSARMLTVRILAEILGTSNLEPPEICETYYAVLLASDVQQYISMRRVEHPPFDCLLGLAIAISSWARSPCLFFNSQTAN